MRSDRIRFPLFGIVRQASAIGLVLAVLLTALWPRPAAAEDRLDVQLDKATLMRYPPTTETIVLGNPIIADVTMLRGNGTLILTGKSFGETNLVLLDRQGTILAQFDVRVEPSSNLLTVQRGLDRESYSCKPRCQPAVSLGDATTFLNNAIQSVTQRNGLATPSGPAAVAGPH